MGVGYPAVPRRYVMHGKAGSSRLWLRALTFLDRFRSRGLHPSTGSGQCLAEAQDWDVPPYRAFYEALGFRLVRRYLLLRWDLAAPLPVLPL